MNVYWKVHRNDFDSFIEYLLKRYKFTDDYDIRELKTFYNKTVFTDNTIRIDYLYLYLSNDDDSDLFSLTYTTTEYIHERKWIIDWKYMGEFNDRKKKLKKINDISDKL